MTTSTAGASTASVGAARGEVGLLWPLLDDARCLHRAWEESRLEEDRLAMLGAWHIHITCTGALDPDLRPWGRCTPTVLVRDTGDQANHMVFRGACLGCGWVAQAVHGIRAGGENAAAEDANDHTHPTWRTLPVVERPPRPDTAAAALRAVQAWRTLGTDPSSRVAGPRRPDPHPPRGRHPTCPRSLPRRRLRHARGGHRRRPP